MGPGARSGRHLAAQKPCLTSLRIQKPVYSPSASPDSQNERFKHEYKPTQPPEMRLASTEDAPGSLLRITPDMPPPSYWKKNPPGAFQIRNPHAQKMRLQPAGIPSPQQGFLPLPTDEYYFTEVQRDYKKDWPSVERLPDGRFSFRPGFLETLQDPEVPHYMYASGIQRVHYSLADRAVQALVTAAYATVAAAAFAFAWSQNYNLAAALLVSWARDRLSLPKVVTLLALAWFDKVWVYWVFLAGSLVDNLLQRIAPPIRRFSWMLFNLWLLFLVLGPAHVYPLPFWPFDAHQAAAPMIIPQG